MTINYKNERSKELSELTKKQVVNLIIEVEEERKDFDEKQKTFIHNKDMQINKLEAIVGRTKEDLLTRDRMEDEMIALKAVVAHLNGLVRYAIELDHGE